MTFKNEGKVLIKVSRQEKSVATISEVTCSRKMKTLIRNRTSSISCSMQTIFTYHT